MSFLSALKFIPFTMFLTLFMNDKIFQTWIISLRMPILIES